MSLFDAIEEISKKEITKTETGDNRILGVVIGVVANNYNEQMPGRICVNIPNRDKDANELKWARVAMPSSGSKWGHYFLPEVGDEVLVAFEQGNIERPFVIGCIPKSSDSFISKSVSEKNETKRIVTKNGNAFTFTDAAEGEGDNDKVKIESAKGQFYLEMNNEKHELKLSDKDGKNSIKINSEKNQMEILADEKLTIKVGSIELIMNGKSNATELTTGKFKVEASANALINSTGELKMTGNNIKAESGGLMNLSSSGVL